MEKLNTALTYTLIGLRVLRLLNQLHEITLQLGLL